MDVPWLFLSHSGAQKDFAWRLYQELVHVGHSAFFDQDAQDSLPKGQPFPPRIVQACRGCRMGIVVLSEQYLESLWPMLELEQLTFHNPSSHCILYPLFHSVPPADLSNNNKLRQWQAAWDSKALEWQSKVKEMQAASTSHLQISIDISSWPEALKRLRYQSGDVFHPHMDDRAYIQTVVSNICKTFPPPRARYLLDEHIRGMDRMQQEINDLFQQALPKSGNSTSAVCLGVWGLGGSGKTTLCKNMTNFYRRDFPGRCRLLELPTEKDEGQLVKAMKEVLLTRGLAKNNEIEMVSSLEVIMSHLEEGLKGHQVFLAIDNVWDWSIERAKQVVSMACTVAGSKILVTSRSKQVLQRLLPWRIVPVPSVTENEAVEVLKSLSFFLPDVILPKLEDLKGLAQLCFFQGQCHPLLLKMMGDTLRHRGGRINYEQGWKDLISRLQTRPLDDEENTILEVLERSLLALTPKLQNTFIDLVTCGSSRWQYTSFIGQCKWLSMLHDGFTKMDIRDQLIELEYHGLLEIKEDESIWRQISIHDLHKSVARRRAPGRNACFFQGCLSDLSIDDKCRNTKYIHASVNGSEEQSLMRVLMHCSKLEILILIFYSGPFVFKRLSLSSMEYLRFLELRDCKFLEEIEGWEGTPNLVSLTLRSCHSLQKLGDMRCLRKLENLFISGGRCVPDLSPCGELKMLVLFENKGLKHLACLGQPPKLEELTLSNNTNLKNASTVYTFTTLRKLNFAGCKNLEIMGWILCGPLVTDMEEVDLSGCSQLRIPDLTNVRRLKVLRAAWCKSLEMVKLGVSAVSSLQVLDLVGCTSLMWQFSNQLPLGSLSRALELLLCDGDVTTNHGSMQLALLHRPICINGLVNLRVLAITGSNAWNSSSLDVSGLTLLEECYLGSFPSLQEIQGWITLVKLSKLELDDFPSLTDITGLDALPRLKELLISNCSRLRWFLGSSDSTHDGSNKAIYIKTLDPGHYSAAHFVIPVITTSHYSAAQVLIPVFPACLNKLHIKRCSSLKTLPSLPAAGALENLSLHGCSKLMDMSSLATTPLPFLCELDLRGCSSLRGFPNLTHLTSLKSISLDNTLDSSAIRQLYKGVLFTNA